jgi:hypothetical protein
MAEGGCGTRDIGFLSEPRLAYCESGLVHLSLTTPNSFATRQRPIPHVARLPPWVKTSKAQNEHMFSKLGLKNAEHDGRGAS